MAAAVTAKTKGEDERKQVNGPTNYNYLIYILAKKKNRQKRKFSDALTNSFWLSGPFLLLIIYPHFVEEKETKLGMDCKL